uniref:Ribonuclease VapC n=1 Tax=Caulobacter sp. (strain K31) TaxID=366602 RepID=B0SW79_CAUSK
MMVVDASALVSILLREPGWGRFMDAILGAGGGLISPVNAWETHIRTVAFKGEAGRAEAESLMDDLNLVITPIDAEQTRIAIEARLRYGRNVLNMGDCFAYALAKTHGGGVLLYQGEDFTRTDILSALPAA